MALPPHNPMRCWAQHLRPDSTVWPFHMYRVWPCQRAKNTHVLYGVKAAYNTCPHKWRIMGSMRKNLIGKNNLSIESNEVNVWLVRLLTTKLKSLKRVETCHEKYFTLWLFLMLTCSSDSIFLNSFYSLDIYIYICVICSTLNYWLFICIWMTLFLSRVWKDT